MSKIQFYGYIDNQVISSGFLIPVYSDGDTFYFHELSKDNKFITNFKGFSPNFFKRDDVTPLMEAIPVAIGSESYMVIKFNNQVEVGTFTKMLDFISRKIAFGELKSKMLIDNAKRVFGNDFKAELLQEAIKVFSSLKGITRKSLMDFLSKYSGPRLINVAHGVDNQFDNYFEELINLKNKRVLRVPANVDIIVDNSYDCIVFFSGHRQTVFNGEITSITNHVAGIGMPATASENIWRIKKEGDRSYYEYCIYSDRKIGVEMAQLACKLNHVVAEKK